MDLPAIYVAPHQKLRGLADLETLEPEKGEPFGMDKDARDLAEGMGAMAIRDAMSSSQDTDAHFVCYVVRKDGRLIERCPRLTKGVLGQLQEVGYSVEMTCVALDLDLKDQFGHGEKLPWAALSKEQDAEIEKLLDAAQEKLAARGMAWSYAYKTRNGLRFIIVLANPVPAGDGYEALLVRVQAEYRAAGLVCDEACRDWTRYYRLPRVRRDGEDTGAQPWFAESSEWARVYEPNAQDAKQAPKPAIQVKPLNIARPDPEAARGLVEVLNPANNQWQLTEAAKKAKKALRGTQAFDVIFNRIPIAREGRRHDTLTKTVGEVVGYLHGKKWATPELVYGLLYESAGRLGEDEDWTGKVWEMTTSFWARETAKAKPQDDTGRQPLIAATPDGRYHIRLADGGFDPLGVPGQLLVARVLEKGSPIEVVHRNKDGEVTGTRSAQKILDEGPTTSVARTVGRVGCNECFIEQQGTAEATLVIPLPEVRTDLPPLPPEQFAEILDYYRATLPAEQVEHFLDALAALPMERHRTAAISITGPGSSGKDMIGEAVSRLWRHSHAGVDSIVGNFQEDLVSTGFVWVNEAHGLPAAEVKRFASRFRQLVGGTRHVVQRKFRTNLEVERCYRVLFTANDNGLLHALIGDEGNDGNEMGLEATSMRLARFEFTEGGVRWLAARGGMQHTNRPGAEWVDGDPHVGGMRLVRFILDLARMAQDGRRPITHRDPKGRFLVRGTDLATEGRDLLIERGVAPDVLQAVLAQVKAGRGAARLIDGNLFVQAAALSSWLLAERGSRVPPKAVSNVLRRLAVQGASANDKRAWDPERRRWWQLDVALVREHADRLELPATGLDLTARADSTAVLSGVRV